MKKILMIGTGGTIASRKTEEGLEPALSPEELLDCVPEVKNICSVDITTLFSIDSTNMTPQHWLKIAECIRDHYEGYDGFVISHGTDTMAYTAAALSYLVQNSGKPVILTGAQKPMGYDDTDSRINLRDAFVCACTDTLQGVFVVFNGQVILGTRARKTHSKSFQAFSSINYPVVASLRDNRVIQYIYRKDQKQPKFYDALDSSVGLLKMIPGTDWELLDYLLNTKNAVIIESFGVGGLPSYGGEEFFSTISSQGVEKGKFIVMTTQVQNEGSDIAVYHVGNRLKSWDHIMEAYDMTTESVLAKLMWILAQTKDSDEVEKMFYTPIANDILVSSS